MDEVFGSENFVSHDHVSEDELAARQRRLLAGAVDYLLWYARDYERVKYRQLFHDEGARRRGAGYDQVLELADGTRTAADCEAADELSAERCSAVHAGQSDESATSVEQTAIFAVRVRWQDATDLAKGDGRRRRRDGAARDRRSADAAGNTLRYVRFVDDFPAFRVTNVWTDTGGR